MTEKHASDKAGAEAQAPKNSQFFSGRNKDWLYVAVLTVFGALAVPGPQGIQNPLAFSCILGGVFFGMALMLVIRLYRELGR